MRHLPGSCYSVVPGPNPGSWLGCHSSPITGLTDYPSPRRMWEAKSTSSLQPPRETSVLLCAGLGRDRLLFHVSRCDGLLSPQAQPAGPAPASDRQPGRSVNSPLTRTCVVTGRRRPCVSLARDVQGRCTVVREQICLLVIHIPSETLEKSSVIFLRQ